MSGTSRVLTIDDEPGIRKAFAAYLEHAGYETLEAGDGASGLEQIRAGRPDIVLCDLRMPGMDGLDVLSRLREEFPELPVIVVSGAGSMTDAVEALKRGAWDYVTKPISDITLLVTAVSRCLERAELLRQNREYHEHLEELNRELSRALQQLRDDQEAGKRIQFQLLPPDGETFGEYSFSRRLFPSTFLSGDFIDYFAINDHNVGFYVADVSGHGAASAFVTVMIKTLVRQYRLAYVQDGDHAILHPEQTLQRIDRDLKQQSLDKHVTMFYGVLDHREHTLTFSCGGQYPYPILCDGQQTRLLDRPGRAVGLFPDAKFESEKLAMPERARLLLVSDGVLEVLPQGTLQEQNAALRAQVERTDLCADDLVTAFGLERDQELRDDVGLLLLQRASHG